MSYLIDRNSFPSGGWQFYQTETKWNKPNPLNDGFYETARIIHQHRLANGIPSSFEKAQTDLENYTKARFPTVYSIPGSNVQPRASGCRSCGR
jgi:hypothetical protein